MQLFVAALVLCICDYSTWKFLVLVNSKAGIGYAVGVDCRTKTTTLLQGCIQQMSMTKTRWHNPYRNNKLVTRLEQGWLQPCYNLVTTRSQAWDNLAARLWTTLWQPENWAETT